MNNTVIATEVIKKIFHDKPMFPIFGNHEFYPCDQDDYNFKNQNQVLDISADIWSSYLTPEASEHLRSKGYYSMSISERNLKVIMLNTQICDLINFSLIGRPR